MEIIITDKISVLSDSVIIESDIEYFVIWNLYKWFFVAIVVSFKNEQVKLIWC